MARASCSTVLIVEDEEDIRGAIQTLLEDEGYRAYTASNGEEALRILHGSVKPCLILLDLMMPVMDGWELMEQLQRDTALASIPVTVVSAARYQGTVRPARFIKKPLNADLLIETVREFCGPPGAER